MFLWDFGRDAIHFAQHYNSNYRKYTDAEEMDNEISTMSHEHTDDEDEQTRATFHRFGTEKNFLNEKPNTKNIYFAKNRSHTGLPIEEERSRKPFFTVRKVLSRLPWKILPFAGAMFVIVEGMNTTGVYKQNVPIRSLKN